MIDSDTPIGLHARVCQTRWLSLVRQHLPGHFASPPTWRDLCYTGGVRCLVLLLLPGVLATACLNPFGEDPSAANELSAGPAEPDIAVPTVSDDNSSPRGDMDYGADGGAPPEGPRTSPSTSADADGPADADTPTDAGGNPPDAGVADAKPADRSEPATDETTTRGPE